MVPRSWKVIQTVRAWAAERTNGMQALERTQPGLPLKKGRAATMTHDYKPPLSGKLSGALR